MLLKALVSQFAGDGSAAAVTLFLTDFRGVLSKSVLRNGAFSCWLPENNLCISSSSARMTHELALSL